MEVVEANPNLAPILASYAKECLESGIPKYSGVEQDPTAYLSGLVERSKAISELPKGYLPSTTYYCVSNSEILGAIRVRKGTNANVENVIGHVGYETRPSARGKGVASFLLAGCETMLSLIQLLLLAQLTIPRLKRSSKTVVVNTSVTTQMTVRVR